MPERTFLHSYCLTLAVNVFYITNNVRLRSSARGLSRLQFNECMSCIKINFSFFTFIYSFPPRVVVNIEWHVYFQ